MSTIKIIHWFQKTYTKLLQALKCWPIHLNQVPLDKIELLRNCICNAPVFPYPSTDQIFVLDCDESDVVIGCELSQLVEGKKHIIIYVSFALTPTQHRYCTTHKELQAVLHLHVTFDITC